MSQDTREAILRAAHEVIVTKGVNRLTLDEVARTARLSKGGLLYHFASKESLIQAMLEGALSAFERELDAQRGTDRSPGSWLRAYIRTSFPRDARKADDPLMIGTALLAGLGVEPSLMKPYSEHLARWANRAAADGLPAEVAHTIRLAVDGLWLQESLGLQPCTPAERSVLVEAMLVWTHGASATANA